MYIKACATSIALTLLASTCLAGSNGPIKSVALSSGGLAEIVRQAEVTESNSLTIEVPKNQVNDLLKTLSVNDKAGGLKAVTLDGPAPVQETFASMPFQPGDLRSLPAIFEALKGTKVVVDNKQELATILGTETASMADGEERVMLSLLWPDGRLSAVPVYGSKITIAEPVLRQKLETAMGVIATAAKDATRTIKLSFAGNGNRPVELSYVIAAPIWKTSYRLMKMPDGKARLQAFAVFENATGEDWNDVDVTLSSGKPVTLTQKLHERHWKQRDELAVDTANVEIPEMQMRTADAMPISAMAAAPMAMEVARGAGVSKSYEMSSVAQTSATEEGDTGARFKLPSKVTAKNGETVSVPILDSDVGAEMVSIYDRNSGDAHPVAAALLQNESKVSLPPGIMTVYDANDGFVGDAEVRNFPVDGSQTVRFALDQKVAVDVEEIPKSSITKLKVADGMITVTHSNEQRTVYTIQGAADAPRTVVIAQDHQAGASFKADHAIDREMQKDRMKVVLAAGERKVVTAIVMSDYIETISLADIDPYTIEMFVASTSDDDTKAKLKALGEARSKQMAAQRALEDIERGLKDAMEDQQNTRQNLSAVPAGDLQERYLQKLGASEDRLEELQAKRKAALETIEEFEAGVRRAIQRF